MRCSVLAEAFKINSTDSYFLPLSPICIYRYRNFALHIVGFGAQHLTHESLIPTYTLHYSTYTIIGKHRKIFKCKFQKYLVYTVCERKILPERALFQESRCVNLSHYVKHSLYKQNMMFSKACSTPYVFIYIVRYTTAKFQP